MTEVIQSSPTSSSSSSLRNLESQSEEEQERSISRVLNQENIKERDQNSGDEVSLLALLVTLFRKSFWVTCKNSDRAKLCSGMDIGWPTNVRHVAHVTFDRFNGFLGLPVEFQPEVPTRPPSASTTVFGVSTESMQLSYDHRGNSVPTILLLMQQRLYDQGGLQAEGIFRINADNGQEEFVRNQLNAGVVPVGIDVHCLAGLIKDLVTGKVLGSGKVVDGLYVMEGNYVSPSTSYQVSSNSNPVLESLYQWHRRELPAGVLDTLSAEQVMQCQTEEDFAALLRLLPATEAALLDWAINLMADVVQKEHLNKMNTHNIAMVFAPNMTQMADPLTALMYAVQVMNLLRALISKTLKERKNFILQASPGSQLDPSNENGHQDALQLCREVSVEEVAEDPHSETVCDNNQVSYISDEEYLSYTTTIEESDGGEYSDTLSRNSSVDHTTESSLSSAAKNKVEDTAQGSVIDQSSESNYSSKISEKISGEQIVVQALGSINGKGISNLSIIDSRSERTEAWR